MAKVLRDVPAPVIGAYGQPKRIRYESDDRIILPGFECDWRCKETNGDGHIFVAEHDPKFTRAYSHEEMRVVASKPGYRHDRHWYSPRQTRARLRAGVSMLSDLPYGVRMRVIWKKDLIEEVEKLRRQDPKTVTLGDEPLTKAIFLADQKVRLRYSKLDNNGKRGRAGRLKTFPDPPGPKAFREWMCDFVDGGRDPLALAPRTYRSGNRDERFDDERAPIVKEFARRYAAPNKPSILKCWEDMEQYIEKTLNPERKKKKLPPLAVPSYGRLYREIEMLDHFEVLAGREGIDEAIRQCQSYGDGIQDVLRPLQHVEIDHWTVHLQTILIQSGAWEKLTRAARRRLKTVRMHLAIAMCRRTHVILGMTLSRTASTQSIIRLLEMTLADKKKFADAAGAVTPYDIYGVMEHMFSDGGSPINNREVHTVLRDLQIGFHCPPGGVPRLRGMVERMFRSIDEGLLSWFEGRTFADVKAKGEYDAARRAGTTLDELGRVLVLFAVDCHHNKPMAALAGRTPREEYIRLTREHGVWGTPDHDKLRNIFGYDIKRRLTAGGIRFLNIRYRSKRLHEMFLKHGGIELTCRVHPANLGAISVKIGKRSWLTVRTSKVFHLIDAETWIGAEAELRKHAKYVKKEITGSIITNALQEFDRVAQIGRKRADISDNPLSREKALAAEARMEVFAAYPDDEYNDTPEPSTELAPVVWTAPRWI
ncbi:putative transposase [Bradyrhizobium diazoefficiens]